MKRLELVTGGTYDIVTNNGLVLVGLQFLEAVSMYGKPSLSFLTPSRQVQFHNISYIAVIAESPEGGAIDESVPGEGEGPVRP